MLYSIGWKGSRPGGAGASDLGSRGQASSLQFWYEEETGW